MAKKINYIIIDGRGEHESFRDCVTSKLKELKEDEGLHIIKDFEPFPLYKMMADKGFDRRVKKISENEFHAYFTPKEKGEEVDMSQFLDVDDEEIKKMVDIKVKFINGEMSKGEARKLVNATYDKVTADEFALGEQYLLDYGITDDVLTDRMDDLLEIFDDVIEKTSIELPKGHPISTYIEEVNAIKNHLNKMRHQLKKKFIKNEWMETYELLDQVNIHLSRKQNQLFSALERKGFDRPSKVMWTLDNKVRDTIKEAFDYLRSDDVDSFLNMQHEVIDIVDDMMDKEMEILFPTSLELLSNDDFVEIRKGDDEIGYCLIDPPVAFGVEEKVTDNVKNGELLADLSKLLAAHGVIPSSGEVLDVSQGKLTLEQINLIFKHLKVDLSFVDENGKVSFYSDTRHRVFPRSPGVIGRDVENCHPRESVDKVEEIFENFRDGKASDAEFWLERGGRFIYIVYTAVRDSDGTFRGVLEMMQDVTKIRSLSGEQRLASWVSSDEGEKDNKKSKFGITGDTLIGDIIKKYPFIKEFLVSLSPTYDNLNDPEFFKIMSNIATIKMISVKGGFREEDLIDKIVAEIEAKS